MIEKFERLEEPKMKNDTIDNVLYFILIVALLVLSVIWYHRNFVQTRVDYVRENQIKSLEQKQRELEKAIEDAQSRLEKINSNQANISASRLP